MACSWPRVSLGELLNLQRRPATVAPNEHYAEIGVYSFGRGLFHKSPRTGLEVGNKDLYLIKEGDFILQITFAWEGAVALASSLEDGMYGSVRFPTFRVELERCLPTFLLAYFRTQDGLFQLGKISPGSAGRNRVLSISRIGEVLVPLPPLVEQQRIVARVDALARRVEKARGLRRGAIKEAEALITSALHEAFEATSGEWGEMAMPDAIAINDRQVDPSSPQYSSLPHISGENIQSKTCRLLPYRTAEQDGVKSGNYLFSSNTILYSKIRPYLQKAVLVGFHGVCSADIYPIKVTSTELEPRFVMWSLVAGPFTQYANSLSGRTRMPKLNRKQLFAFHLRYPPRSDQRNIVAYLDSLQSKVGELRQLQAETQKELDALMPSILAKAFAGEL